VSVAFIKFRLGRIRSKLLGNDTILLGAIDTTLRSTGS
jgi:hypothetical protein